MAIAQNMSISCHVMAKADMGGFIQPQGTHTNGVTVFSLKIIRECMRKLKGF